MNLNSTTDCRLSEDDDTLLGDLLRAEVSAIHGQCQDEEGYTDYGDLDHRLGSYWHELRLLEGSADVLAVFAEESARFAPS